LAVNDLTGEQCRRCEGC